MSDWRQLSEKWDRTIKILDKQDLYYVFFSFEK